MKIRVYSIHASRNVKVFISFSNTIKAFWCLFFILFRTLLLAGLVSPTFPLGVNVVDRFGLTEFCEKKKKPPLLVVKTLFKTLFLVHM